jgi:hypothetical protein
MLISYLSYFSESCFDALTLAASFFFCSSSSEVSLSKLEFPLCCDSVTSLGLAA